MDESFQEGLKAELERFLRAEANKFPAEDTLRIDLHCHDRNSDVPDEQVGRLLSVAETWISSQTLLRELERNGCQAYTITNHNNARSCYEMQDRGHDILTAAEFSCRVPDFDTGIHVLAYGFSPEQERRLNKLRKNIYAFQEFTCEQDIPTIWAHPLYHYAAKRMPSPDFFDRMLLLFERFECLNGQRDTWQNMLVKEWVCRADEEALTRFSKQYGIGLTQYCRHPYRKTLTGGSDSHMGIFSGMTGVYAFVPGLQRRQQTAPRSQLALEAIREGRLAVYGSHQNTEKLTLAFLNYACQIAMNFKDPGLIRLLLHRGDAADKAIALLASNVFGEVQRHRTTMAFIKLFYECMTGRRPPFYKRLFVPSDYRPVFDAAAGMSSLYHRRRETFVTDCYESLLSINSHINEILAGRLTRKISKGRAGALDRIVSEMELPTGIRSWLGKSNGREGVDMARFLDGLSFPFFTSLFILAAHFTSAKTLYHTRPFLKRFSAGLGKFEHPRRILWMTDTYGGSDGVSAFLRQLRDDAGRRSLPLDIVVCGSGIRSDEHLIVLKPLVRFAVPSAGGVTVGVPNFVELHNLFLAGGYDRIVCSTEGVMGLFALYLKHACTVEASFCLHADRLAFVRDTLHFDRHNSDRVRRVLRLFYRSFDRVFILNPDRTKWMRGPNDIIIDRAAPPSVQPPHAEDSRRDMEIILKKLLDDGDA
ncbi:MAG: hypothetical protein LBL33_03250 [Tannerella sp.]|jgi:hypothetical protein|nr:hypothetical protein [Tannerella sp.]